MSEVRTILQVNAVDKRQITGTDLKRFYLITRYNGFER